MTYLDAFRRIDESLGGYGLKDSLQHERQLLWIACERADLLKRLKDAGFTLQFEGEDY